MISFQDRKCRGGGQSVRTPPGKVPGWALLPWGCPLQPRMRPVPGGDVLLLRCFHSARQASCRTMRKFLTSQATPSRMFSEKRPFPPSRLFS